MSVRPFIPRRQLKAGTLIAAALAATTSAHAQLATLDKGHQLLLNDGLQIWGTNTDSYNYQLNYPNYNDANFSGVMWSHGQSRTDGTLPAGEKWSKWVD